jgi:hypothetical protein
MGHVFFREFLKFVVVLTDVLNNETKMLRRKIDRREESHDNDADGRTDYR